MKQLNYLLSLTPLETWRILRHRLPLMPRGPSWTPAELLSSSKHSRGIRFAELLLRQEAIVRRQMDWPALDFDGKRVVEIGCGPLAGYGPLAIFCGAQSFESAEPEWDEGLFASELVADDYLRTLHADLAALYGPRMAFDAFTQALRERVHISRSYFEDAPITPGVDIVLSQSCLEHVTSLDATVAKLAAIQTPRTRSLHLVDFGNHYPTVNPFEGLYEQEPQAYIAKRGPAINLLRAPDVAAAFERVNLPVRVFATRMMADTYRGRISDYWTARYDRTALFTQLALVAGPA